MTMYNWMPIYGNDESLDAWQQRINAIMPIIETHPEYQAIRHDYMQQLAASGLHLSDGYEDMDVVALSMVQIVADISYKIGKMNIVRVLERQSQHIHLPRYAAFTRSATMVQQHDVAFRQYIAIHAPAIATVVERINAGDSWTACARLLGKRSKQQVIAILRQTFDRYLESTGQAQMYA